MLMRNKIELLGVSDVKEFVKACDEVKGGLIVLTNSLGFRINARSYLGVLAAISDWDLSDLWVESDIDIYSAIEKWVKIGDDKQIYHS